MFRNSDKLAVLILLIAGTIGGYQYYQNQKIENEPPKEIKVGVKDAAGGDLLLNVADKEGFFKKEGIKVTMVAAPNNITALLSSGEVDVTTQMVSASLVPFLNGENFKLIAMTEKYTNNFGVSKYSKEELGKIKKVGVPRIGGSLHYTVYESLQNLGINPDSVKFVNTGGTTANSIALLEKNEIDFAFIDQGDLDKLTGSYTFIGPKDLYGDKLTPGGLVTTQATIDKKGEVLQSYVNAIYRARGFLVKNQEESLAYIDNGAGLSNEKLVEMYAEIKDTFGISVVPEGNMLQDVLPIVVKISKPQNPEKNIEEFIFQDFAKRAAKIKL
jgi:ABC-type nitrate/sulfonate/bicarbonate transport system substrate-binding protein